MKSNLRIALATGLTLTALGVAALASMSSPKAPLGGPSDEVAVERGALVEVASVSGVIEPDMQVEVLSRIAGEVIEVRVEVGDVVEEGAVLFRLDPTDAQLTLQSARSELARSRAALTEAEAQLAVAQTGARHADETAKLEARGVELGLVASDAARESQRDRDVARSEVVLRQAQVTSAQAQVTAAEVSVKNAQRNMERTEITAPFGGTVLSVGVERGTIITSPMGNVSGGTTLVTLADLSDLRVVGALDEAQVGKVLAGQPVRFVVDAYPDRSFEGRVHLVSPLGTVDTNVVVFDVEVLVTDPDASLLRSGMSADLEIETSSRQDVLLLPLTAIRTSSGRRTVTLPSGEQRGVQTGATDGQRIEIVAGLGEGERVLSDGRSPSAPKEEAPRSGLFPPPPGRRR